MQYPGEFRPLNLMMLPFDERTCLYNNEFMLADNMDSSGKAIDLASDSETAPFMASPYPFKIEFYMGLVCLEGSMKVETCWWFSALQTGNAVQEIWQAWR